MHNSAISPINRWLFCKMEVEYNMIMIFMRKESIVVYLSLSRNKFNGTVSKYPEMFQVSVFLNKYLIQIISHMSYALLKIPCWFGEICFRNDDSVLLQTILPTYFLEIVNRQIVRRYFKGSQIFPFICESKLFWLYKNFGELGFVLLIN